MKLVKTALLSAVCLAGAFGAAHAADAYRPAGLKDIPASMPPIVWSGLYVGLNAGAIVSDTVSATWSDGSDVFEGSRHDGASYLLGGQLGYNWQTGNLVFGFEADITASGAELVKYLATLRGRAGLAMDKSLVYVTGGIASLEWDLDDYIDGSYSTSGWVIGAGFEHKINRDLSFGVEALYYSFNDKASDGTDYAELDRDMWAIRGRVNFHLGGRDGMLK